MRVSIDVASKQPFSEIIEKVRATRETMVVTGEDGDLVKVVPIPKPIRYFNNRPVYKLSDVQNLDFPYWDDDTTVKQ